MFLLDLLLLNLFISFLRTIIMHISWRSRLWRSSIEPLSTWPGYSIHVKYPRPEPSVPSGYLHPTLIPSPWFLLHVPQCSVRLHLHLQSTIPSLLIHYISFCVLRLMLFQSKQYQKHELSYKSIKRLRFGSVRMGFKTSFSFRTLPCLKPPHHFTGFICQNVHLRMVVCISNPYI